MNFSIFRERPLDHPWYFDILNIILTSLGVFLGCLLFLYLIGYDPLLSMEGLWLGSFGSSGGLIATLERWSPVILTSLSALYAFRCGFINLGAEGQMLVGAAAAGWIALTFSSWRAEFVIPLALLASMVGGAIPSLLCAWLKSHRKVNEALSSLLLNTIIYQLYEMSLRIDYPGKIGNWIIPLVGLKNPLDAYPRSPEIPLNSQLPVFSGFSLALPISLLFILLVSILLFKTPFGFQSRVTGKNPFVAAYAGFNRNRTILATGCISGLLAGLGGGMEVLGTRFQLISGLLSGTGFEGITAAIISGLHPVGMLFSSLLLAALRAGSNRMQILSGTPYSIILLFQALIILLVLSGIQQKSLRGFLIYFLPKNWRGFSKRSINQK